MKKIGILLAIVIILLGGIFVLTRGENKGELKENRAYENNEIHNEKYIEGKIDLPESYTEKVEEGGTLTTLEYSVNLKDGSGKKVTKKANVYLPYGYDENKEYNIFYLMHGYGGNRNTFLGSKVSPRPFKYVLDNMIENGDIEPLIVVALDYTDEYANDYYMQISETGNELVEAVIPAAESTYSTYAAGNSVEDYISSREHRAVGGFSMGGCATWYTLMDHVDYFKYYLPTSMPIYYNDKGYVELENNNGAYNIATGVAEKEKEGDYPFFVYAASGDDDFMCEATKMQGKALDDYEGFTYCESGFKEGNIVFNSWEGHNHSYKESFPYMYNGLIRFFKDL